jgi:hypothetical protein
MNQMRMPEFAAQNVFPAANTGNRVVGALMKRENEGKGIPECIMICTESGKSLSECKKECQPSPSTPYHCTPQDDSVNRNICLVASTAWFAACNVDCGLLSAIPFAGLGLAATCSYGCIKAHEFNISQCSTGTRCV